MQEKVLNQKEEVLQEEGKVLQEESEVGQDDEGGEGKVATVNWTSLSAAQVPGSEGFYTEW